MRNVLLAVAALAAAYPDLAAGQEADAEFDVSRISASFHVISTVLPNGFEAHVGLGTGRDGALLIDALGPDLAEQLVATIDTLADRPVKYVINTHIHSDHTGANGLLRRRGATIIRARDDVQRFKDPDEPAPDIEFSERLVLRVNGEEVVVTRFESHSDGDAIVYLPDSNVLFMGDTHLSEWLPQSRDWRAVYRFALDVADDDTVIVLGHGRLSSKADLEGYVRRLERLHATVSSLHREGTTVAEIVTDEDVLLQVDRISLRYGSAEGELRRALERVLEGFVADTIAGGRSSSN